MKRLIRSIRQGSKVLFITGLVHIMLAILFLLLMGWDTRQVNDENVWLKPFRFAVSIFLFTWTYAWISGFYVVSARKQPKYDFQRFNYPYPKGSKSLKIIAPFRGGVNNDFQQSEFSGRHYVNKQRLVNTLNWIIATCMFVEIALISMQAGRGVASHFNVSTPFDAAVFSVMGAVIGFNALIIGLLFVIFTWFDSGGGDYRYSVIWGMFLFLLGNFAGYLIIRYGWSVPAIQLVESLPVTGWKAGLNDLRIPHAIGLHAIQVMPLSMWVICKTGTTRKAIHWIGGGYLLLYLVSLLLAL